MEYQEYNPESVAGLMGFNLGPYPEYKPDYSNASGSSCGCSNGFSNASGGGCGCSNGFSNASGTSCNYRNQTGTSQQRSLMDILNSVVGSDGIKTDLQVSLYPAEYLKLGIGVAGGVFIGLLLHGAVKRLLGAS